MKTSYLYLFSLLILSFCCFSCEKPVDKDEETIEENYPIEIAFTEYRFGETMCGWIVEKFNYNDEVIVINSREELENYILCTHAGMYPDMVEKDTFPAIDFSTHTLLLASGSAGYAISSIAKNLQQVSAGKFQLDVAIELNDTPIYERWIIALLTGKLGEESIVELNVALCDEEENYPLEDPYTEYSVWRYTDSDAVIELAFYPENKIHIKPLTPGLPAPPYRIVSESIMDYYIKNNIIYFGSKKENSYYGKWYITCLSDNELMLRFMNISLDPRYQDFYLFTRQTDLK